MNSLNFKLLGVAVLLLALLVCEISSVEEKKVMRRKKVLPASTIEVEPNRDGHYRVQKKLNHPLIRDGKKKWGWSLRSKII